MENPPPPARHWNDREKQKCVEAANAVLDNGGADSEAIYACIAAAGKGQVQESADYAEPLDMFALLGLKPRDALEYFRGKGYQITWDWWEAWGAAQERAFTTAKLLNVQALRDLGIVAKMALENGWDLDRFREESYRTLSWYGLLSPSVPQANPFRLELIYRQNMLQAYNAGRYLQQMQNADNQPLWEYLTANDSRVRDDHDDLHGIVLPANDPFWDSFYPQNGFNCRCRVAARSRAYVERRQLAVTDSRNKLSQEMQKVGVDANGNDVMLPGMRYRGDNPNLRRRDKFIDVMPDPGFSHNPGQSLLAKLQEQEAAVRAQVDQIAGRRF